MVRLRISLALALAAAGLVALAPAASAESFEQPAPAGANDFGCEPTKRHPRPVVLLHGLGARAEENWSYNSPRLAAAGYCVFTLTYGVDPRTVGQPYAPGGVIRMQESSKELKLFVSKVLRRTGARKVDLVGHSEGTVMPRWYLERRGGARKVLRFVALTPLWRGTQLGGVNVIRDLGAGLGLSGAAIDLFSQICASCPQFLHGSDYLNELNADGEPVPGVKHTNIPTRYDELVVPYTSGIMLGGGRNLVLQDVCPLNTSEHLLVAFDPVVTRLIENALDPKRARPVGC